MTTLDVYINDGYLPMVDGSSVYHRGFGEAPTPVSAATPSLTISPHVFTADGRTVKSRTYPLDAALPPEGRPVPAFRDPEHPGEYLVRRAYWASYFPERTLIAESGAVVSLRVHNTLSEPRALLVVAAGPGGTHVGTGPIPPQTSVMLEFDAPPPGTYIYCDPGTRPDDPRQDPVQRTLGLFGALLVANTSAPWLPAPGGPEFERQWLWLLHCVDPAWARRASRGETIDPATTPAYPRYFTLNGRSGFQSLALSTDKAANLARYEETLMSGSARQVDVRDFSASAVPGTVRAGHLMRFLNPGVVHHQLHFHGNHVWAVGRNGVQYPRTGGFVDPEGHIVMQTWEDVVEMRPMDRKDCVLPMRRPPEVIDAVWNARTADWHYPMHCHAEPSQVARGGMYPGGLVGDWILAAPVPVPLPPGGVVPLGP